MSVDLEAARQRFQDHFGGATHLAARAPGRVNIIGEHTDYNEGFVLPMAIERETVILARPREDMTLNACAANFNRAAQSSLEEFARNPGEPWVDYVVGVAREVAALGKPLVGADLMIVGDVPIGAGLSSSASLEMAALVLFERLGGFELAGPEAARLGKRVENDFLGVNSGIMDQFIARMGEAGHALFLDCRSYDYELIPVALHAARFVIADTGVSRGLTASKYNERVAECREAVYAMAGKLGKDAPQLRDFTLPELCECQADMREVVFRRARHVITEDERTQAACRAMRDGDAGRLGALMNESDKSLREDYEVTCPELDAMTAIARSLPGCYGSRMTGAGFGGCTVSLVAHDAIDAFAEQLLRRYRDQTGLEGAVIDSAPAHGAQAVVWSP
ncbi:MAG TPA: galactokinase [Candidatus Hydrogenedentes bacterium]|nr:galactokinase [Candidatus Hydrogenedentota bacterium]